MRTATLVCVFLVAAVLSQPLSAPLFLSQYLPNNPGTARTLSEVKGIGNYTSYSGYITVDTKTFSNTFFWFFPAQNGDADAPLIMWLQGGPGGSSMFGLFSENGPFTVSADGSTLIPNEYTWNQEHAMLYVDNPIGVGFSFTISDEGFVTSEDDVAADLYSFLTQFFQVFPDYQGNDFYISGESYGGKYTPSISYYIHEMNKIAPPAQQINLQGLSIGDGLVDPITQFIGISDLLYYFGMADMAEVQYIQNTYETPFLEALGSGDLLEAFRLFDEFMNGDFYQYHTYFFNITGTNDYFNFLDPVYPPNPYPQYLMLNATRNAIHVGGNVYWDYNQTVEYYLLNDWMTSVASKMPTLMENYKVLVYSGQNDFILGAALSEKWIRAVPWSGSQQFSTVGKTIWYVEDTDPAPAGYVRQVLNFTQCIVRDAGHLLPLDQPRRASDMIRRWVGDIPFSG
eukprot:TRINITY_DN321_c0_g1_i1.p1 TRINITY_DN321_c0_g1~~TRINITY_DN321_c0_g1_i1.p1  ORF type:complete len:455 (-),score=72.62 TRINITY_DN321_c0_g1_i1:52-1416(-)